MVCIPKGRKKALDGKMRTVLGPVLWALAGQRGRTILAGHMVQDYGHRRIRWVDGKETFMGNASGQEETRCPRLVLRKRRGVPLASIRSNSTLKGQMS